MRSVKPSLMHDAGVDVREWLALGTFPAPNALAGRLAIFTEGVIGNDVEIIPVCRHALPGFGRGNAAEFFILPTVGAWRRQDSNWGIGFGGANNQGQQAQPENYLFVRDS